MAGLSLIILSKKLDKKNIKASNKNFSEKKNFYSESRLIITKEIIKYEKWGFKEIEERQKNIYEISKEIWN